MPDENTKMASLIKDIIDTDLCIGCGLCAALCPEDSLVMQWNQYGEYSPVEVSSCITRCGLCEKVCPFSDTGENEDKIGERLYGMIPQIQWHPDTGFYIASYAGYSEKYRQTSASGGIGTWILESLLTKGVVDHVVCVGPTGDHDRLFTFRVFDTADEVRSGSGSVYYPVEMSEIIRQIIMIPGYYAITGLPCFIKGIRLAQLKNKALQERIIITIGLVCGQMKSRHFTEYIASLTGVKGEFEKVHYRGKSPGQPASNYHYTFTTKEGEEQRIFWKDGISEAWTNRWFTPNACNYCDDIFSECADVTCMDAWLPDYSPDSRGTSLVLVRSAKMQSVLDDGQGICLNPISIEQVIKSQAGVVDEKRTLLAYRLFLRGKIGPVKRVKTVRLKNFFLRHEIEARERMRIMSKDRWREEKGDAHGLRNALAKEIKWLSLERMLSDIISFPHSECGDLVRKTNERNHG